MEPRYGDGTRAADDIAFAVAPGLPRSFGVREIRAPISAIPTVILMLAGQRVIVSELTFGAVK